MAVQTEVNELSWRHFTKWRDLVTPEQQRRALRLLIGVTCFSLAMDGYALLGNKGIALSWVVAAGLAVVVGTVQMYKTFQDSLRNERLQAAAVQALNIWQGIYAVAMCGSLILILSFQRVRITVVDFWIGLGAGSGTVLSIVIYFLGKRAWAKFGQFFSLKVLPQCGQSFFLLAVGTSHAWWFYVAFLGGTIYVGRLRFLIALESYRANKERSGDAVPESRANCWSWGADVLSFVFMASCLAVVLVTGGIWPGVLDLSR